MLNKQTVKEEGKKEMKATIRVWSAIGHTPVTGRKGAYCDELVRVENVYSSVDEIVKTMRDTLENTRYGVDAHYDAPDAPNNFKTGWMKK